MSASQLTMRGEAHAATLFGFGAFLLVEALCTPLPGAPLAPPSLP